MRNPVDLLNSFWRHTVEPRKKPELLYSQQSRTAHLNTNGEEDHDLPALIAPGLSVN
jgi:hypothetical protein